MAPTSLLPPMLRDDRRVARRDRRAASVGAVAASRHYATPIRVPAKLSQVAIRTAELATARGFPMRAGSCHQWIHSATTLRPSDRVALLVQACGEVKDSQLQALILAPIHHTQLQASPISESEALGEWRESSALVDYLTRLPVQRPKALCGALDWAAMAATGFSRTLRDQA